MRALVGIVVGVAILLTVLSVVDRELGQAEIRCHGHLITCTP